MKRVAIQVLCYAGAMALTGYLSALPVYRHLDPQTALLKLSFSHAGERIKDCRPLSPEEIAALPPNMRRPTECERERVPLRVELELDGTLLLDEQLPPSGLARDGASTVYRSFPVTPGDHDLLMRLRDSRREEGFDHERRSRVRLSPGEVLAIDFSREKGGFLLLAAAGLPRDGSP